MDRECTYCRCKDGQGVHLVRSDRWTEAKETQDLQAAVLCLIIGVSTHNHCDILRRSMITTSNNKLNINLCSIKKYMCGIYSFQWLKIKISKLACNRRPSSPISVFLSFTDTSKHTQHASIHFVQLATACEWSYIYIYWLLIKLWIWYIIWIELYVNELYEQNWFENLNFN